jgi:hypothetical protein
MKAEWGLETKDPNAKFCWGARAIYKLNFEEVLIDILHDRQSWAGEHTTKDRISLSTWLNTKALNHLKVKLAKRGIGSASSESESIEGDGFCLCASPRASYGYLYLVAEPCTVTTPLVEIEEPKRKLPKNARRSYRLGSP